MFQGRSAGHRRSITVVAGVTLLSAGLALTGCGSSDSGGSSSGSGGGGTGDIKVMAVGVFESAALSLPDAVAGLKAEVAAVNEKGGIKGRNINLIICNDKF